MALAVLVLVCVVAVVTMRVLFPLPDRPADRPPPPVPPMAETALGRLLAPALDAHPGLSGVLALERGVDAFAARVLLIRSATHSIEAQYYIWQDDLTGLRLLAELEAAARRGVEVRLLVDDNGTPALDQELAALDALPHAEVRIFNPFVYRGWRPLNYAFDFFRLNRRMHNKSLTVDGVATIVGGRNIGDVYFETGAGHTYLDLDVLALGPAATEVRADFDRYWTSVSAYPALSVIDLEPGGEGLIAARDAALRETPQARVYSQAVRDSTLIDALRTQTQPMDWAHVRLFSDDPAKALGTLDDKDLMVRRLMDAVAQPERSFDIISAYFIAGTTASDRLVSFAEEGVRVRVLTNSLEATDVVPVHAGYVDDRARLVAGGVELYELRSEGGDRRSVNELGVMELSKSALHAKSFAVDGRLAFIGSMNFDPRSRRLNTEMGLLVDSPTVAGRITGWLDNNLAPLTYRVTPGETGGLVWTAQNPDGSTQSWTSEPNTTAPLRLLVRVMSWLPIQWLL